MFMPGDICTITEEAQEVLTGRLRSLIGKRVMVTSHIEYNGRIPIRVLDPDKTLPWERSNQLAIRTAFLELEEST